MASVTMAVEGSCAAGFERVRDAFAENFAQGGEVGATVAVTVDGTHAMPPDPRAVRLIDALYASL